MQLIAALANRPLVTFTISMGLGICIRFWGGTMILSLLAAGLGMVVTIRPGHHLPWIIALGLIAGVLRGASPPTTALPPPPADLPRLVNISGRVTTTPLRGEFGQQSFRLATHLGTLGVTWTNPCGITCRGDRVDLLGMARLLPPAHEDGRAWRIITTGKNLVPKMPAPWWYLPAHLDRARQQLAKRLDAQLTQPALGLAHCLLLGDSSRLDPWDELRFRHTGTAHLLVVSGLHVAILAGLVLRLTGGRWRWLAALGVVAYAALAGGRPPAMRAAVGFTAWVLAPNLGRNQDLAGTLSIASLPVLLFDPRGIGGPSFQISYCAVAAMGLFGPALRKGLARLGLPRPLAMVYGLSLAASLGTAPLCLYHFGTFSPWSILLTPLLTPILGLAVVMAGLAPWLPQIAETPLAGIHAAQLALLEIVDYCPATPLHSLVWPSTISLAIGGMAALVLLCRTPNRWHPLAGLLLCLPHFIPGFTSPTPARARLLNVGHGQCLVSDLPGIGVVVQDAGSLWAPRQLARRCTALLKQWQRRRITWLCLSHADRDHYNALPYLLANFSVKRIFLPRHPKSLTLARRLQRHGQKPEVIPQNWTHQKSSGKHLLQIFTPGRNHPNANQGSLVIHLQTPEFSLLAPGDLEGPGLSLLLKGKRRFAAKTLIAPHHGARTGLEEELVGALGIVTVLVSRSWNAGPAPAAIAYRRAGTSVYWTAIHGDIYLGLGKGQLSQIPR